jgi:hypothetical protein
MKKICRNVKQSKQGLKDRTKSLSSPTKEEEEEEKGHQRLFCDSGEALLW